jgi:hypothetical protein
MSRSRVPPLILFGLGLLAATDSWLLLRTVGPLISGGYAATEERSQASWLPKLEQVQALTTAPVSYQEILDHPVFSRSRAPFVPPPPAPPPKPASPTVVFVDPGLVLGGVMVAESTKKAYLFQRANRDGSWVAEGEDFVGWKVQSITTDAVRLEKDSRVLEVRLYSEK